MKPPTHEFGKSGRMASFATGATLCTGIGGTEDRKNDPYPAIQSSVFVFEKIHVAFPDASFTCNDFQWPLREPDGLPADLDRRDS